MVERAFFYNQSGFHCNQHRLCVQTNARILNSHKIAPNFVYVDFQSEELIHIAININLKLPIFKKSNIFKLLLKQIMSVLTGQFVDFNSLNGGVFLSKKFISWQS